MPGVPRLRPRHRTRLAQDHPESGADARGRRDRAVPRDGLRRIAERPDTRLPQGGHPDGCAVEEAFRGAPEIRRARRTGLRPGFLRFDVVRRARFLPLAGRHDLQDARAGLPLPLARLRVLPEVPGKALPRGIALLALAGQDAARTLRITGLGPARDARAARAQGFTPPRRPRARGHPRAPRLPRGGRPRLPRARPFIPHALRRGSPARQPDFLPRRLPGGHGLRPRRTERRHARPRPGPHGRDPPQPRRPREYGRGGRTRRVGDARGGLADRDRPATRRRRRAPPLPRSPEGHPEGQGIRDGQLALRPPHARDARPASDRRHDSSAPRERRDGQ